MQNIVPFTFENKTLRTVMINGEPWFVAKDVAEAIGVVWKGSETSGPLDDDEKGLSIVQTPGGEQEMVIISESGMNMMVLRSQEAATPGTPAHTYRKWVTSEVLPSLRKTGSYALDRWFSVREACVFVAPLMAPYGGVPLIPRSIRNLVMPFVNVPEVTRNAIVCGGDVYVKEAYIEQAVCFALTQHQTGMVQPRFYHDLREWLTTQVPLNRVQVLEYNQALTLR